MSNQALIDGVTAVVGKSKELLNEYLKAQDINIVLDIPTEVFKASKEEILAEIQVNVGSVLEDIAKGFHDVLKSKGAIFFKTPPIHVKSVKLMHATGIVFSVNNVYGRLDLTLPLNKGYNGLRQEISEQVTTKTGTPLATDCTFSLPKQEKPKTTPPKVGPQKKIHQNIRKS